MKDHKIKIGDKIISNQHPVFIIAEAGVNHNGDIGTAKKLVDSAIECGADAIKFQNFITEKLIRKSAPKAAYQNKNIGKIKTQFQMLKELELSFIDTQDLKNYCDKKTIIFLSTAYEDNSLNFLESINVHAHKLASIDIVHHPLIELIAKTKKPLILSTGMANEQEIKEASELFAEKSNRKKLILLQCNTNYPANPEDQNLRAMETLKKYSNIIGFSDHTEGQEISIAAIAMGAKIIERHFTLNKNMPGPDHRASMNPKEFKHFVNTARKIELALGSTIKKPTGGEKNNIIGMRRSICAKTFINKDTILTKKLLTYKRPGNGLVPTKKNLKKIIEKKTITKIKEDQNISLKQLR